MSTTDSDPNEDVKVSLDPQPEQVAMAGQTTRLTSMRTVWLYRDHEGTYHLQSLDGNHIAGGWCAEFETLTGKELLPGTRQQVRISIRPRGEPVPIPEWIADRLEPAQERVFSALGRAHAEYLNPLHAQRDEEDLRKRLEGTRTYESEFGNPLVRDHQVVVEERLERLEHAFERFAESVNRSIRDLQRQ